MKGETLSVESTDSSLTHQEARLEKLTLGVASGKCATLVAFAAEPGHK